MSTPSASVAIVGGGAAGMGAAYALVSAGFEVTLFESKPVLGGHCFGVSVPLPDGSSIRIDAGVSDFNEATFETVGGLLKELGVGYYPVCQDASFMTPARNTVWHTRAGAALFVQEPPDRVRLLGEIARFNASCIEVLDDSTYADWTTRKYLDARGYSDEFRTLYFNPRAHGCFPMPDRPPERYMIRSLVAYWRMHGLAGPEPGRRMVVAGGMHAYCAAVEHWLRQRAAQVHLATQVVGIARRKGRVRIRTIDAMHSQATHEFDHVVIATHANHVVPLLEDATQEERRIHAGFGWQRSRIVVHRDASLMPSDRATWGAYNYLIADGDAPEIRPTITFHPNRLASLDASVPDTFVSMNPFREPAAETVISNQFFIHPVVNGISDRACERLDAIQGRRGTWFCGSYLREPFVHEQALRSGVEIGERLANAVRQGRSSMPRHEAGREFDDFLHEIPLFTGLDSLALAEVALVAQAFTANAGDVLFRQGAVADGMYLLQEGAVRISRRLPGDDAIELALLGRGAVIGEMGLLDRGRRSASATATLDCTGYFIGFERFDLLRANGGRAAFVVMTRFVNEVVERTRLLLREVFDTLEATPGLAVGKRGSESLSGRGAWMAPAVPVSESDSDPLFLPMPEVLARLPFFRRLTRTELLQFTQPLKLRSLPRNTLLFRKGDPPGECLIVVRGALSLTLECCERFVQFAVLGPGRIAGEIALLDGQPQPFDCRTREDSLVLVMDADRLEHLRQNGGPAAFKFFETVAEGAVALLRKTNGHAAWLRPEKAIAAERALEGYDQQDDRRT